MAILIVILTACAHTAKVSDTSTEKEKRMKGRPYSALFQHYYLEASIQENAGNLDAAFDLYNRCIEIDSMQPEPYFMLSFYYYDLKNEEMAEKCLKRAIELNPYNDTYSEKLAEWYNTNEEYQNAIDTYERLWAAKHSRTDVLEYLVSLYLTVGNSEGALDALKRLEQMKGYSERVAITKMKIYDDLDRKEDAFAALKQLSDEHPNDINYKVYLANWMMQNDRFDEAKEILLQAEDYDPNNESIVTSLYDYYRLSGNDSVTRIYRNRLLTNKHVTDDTKNIILLQVYGDIKEGKKDSTEMLNLLKMVIDSDPENEVMAKLNADYVNELNVPDSMKIEAMEALLRVAPDDPSARIQTLFLYARNEMSDDIIRICKGGVEYNPEELVFSYYLGAAYYQADRLEDALEAFKNGITHRTDETRDELLADLYTMAGDICHQLERDNEAFAYYDSCLVINPNNVGALNNYAYYLSESGGDLKKAEEMSHKTVVAEPENATFLDTYAWILYREERFLEALEYMTKAVELVDEDGRAVYYEHCGDINAACSNIDTAIEMWTKAIEADENKRDTLEKKIKQYK